MVQFPWSKAKFVVLVTESQVRRKTSLEGKVMSVADTCNNLAPEFHTNIFIFIEKERIGQ